MKKTKFLLAGLLMGSAAALGMSTTASAGEIRVGTLTCIIDGGAGFIITSSKTMGCTFSRSRGSRMEYYSGTFNRFGVDIGVTDQTTLVWAVFAPTRSVRHGTLAGGYVGVGGEATMIGGVGANAMIGGSNDTIQLQPISFQAQSGFNVAGGIASMTLEPARGK